LVSLNDSNQPMLRKLFFLCTVLLYFSEIKAAIIQPIDPAYPASIVAEKNGKKRYYSLGTAVYIRYDDGGQLMRLKGLITKIWDDSVEISSFGNKMQSQVIPLNSIELLTRLNRKTRKIAAILTAVASVLVGTVVIASNGKVLNSPWGFALIAIPAMAIGFYMSIVFGLSYLDQVITKKSVKKGWKFYAGGPAPKKGIFPHKFFE